MPARLQHLFFGHRPLVHPEEYFVRKYVPSPTTLPQLGISPKPTPPSGQSLTIHMETTAAQETEPDQLQSLTEGEPMGNLSGVVQHLKKELERAEKEVLRFGAALAALGSSHSNGRRTLSAAARKKISLAQKKRWATARKEAKPAAAAPAKRTMSASARKKIAAAQRKRWAKVWAQAKKAA